MSDINTDRNLLFGILALQFDFITKENLVAATHEWVSNKSQPLDEVLLDRNMIGRAEHELLRSLLQRQAQAHDGELRNPLDAISSISSVREELESIGDRDVNATLSFIGSAPRQLAADDTTFREQGAALAGGHADLVRPRFRILRRHAKGGLGEVLVAEDTELNRNVALKQIREDLADDEVSRTRFVMEAEVTGGLEHPGIVPVYGLGQHENGRPFYAMRFVKGNSLREAVQQYHQRQDMSAAERNLSLRGLLGRFVDVCQAVEYAHSRGVLHRDLKPGNIMLGKFGETLVVDWGLAKVIDRPDPVVQADESRLAPRSGSGSTPTEFGAAIGTPAFMSPEQAAGRVDELGPASDVYCLGATLFFVLVGEPPQKPTTDEAGRLVVTSESVPNPRQLDHRVPKPLASICMKAMATHAADRYGTPGELAQEVERWLGDEPVQAHDESIPATAARWGRRHYSLVSSGVLVALIAAVGFAFVAWKTDQARREIAEQKIRADAAREEAERHFNRSLDAVDLMLHRVGDERLVDVPQLSLVRKEILQDALQFYNELLKEQPDREDVQFLAARGHHVLGEIHFLLGNQNEAVSHLENGRQLLLANRKSGGSSHSVSHRLGEIQLQLGEHYLGRNQVPKAMAETEDAREYVSSLPRDNLHSRLIFADVLTLQGLIHRHAGRIADAVEAHSEAIKELTNLQETAELREQRRSIPGIAESLGREKEQILYKLQAAHHNRAMIHTQASQAEPAISDYKKARDLQEELLEIASSMPVYVADRANTHLWLAITQAEQTQFSAAFPNYKRSAELWNELVRDFPSVRRYRTQLAATQHNRAVALKNTHQNDEAIADFEASISILNQLAEEQQLEPPEKSDLAGSHSALAWLLSSIGKIDESEEHMGQVLALRQELADESEGTLQEKIMLAAAHHNHASILSKGGHLAEARDGYRKSIDSIHTIELAGERVDALRCDEANSWMHLAAVHARLAETDDADNAYDTANRLFGELVADNPSVPRFIVQHAGSFHNYATFQRQQGRAEEAIANVRESIRILTEAIGEFPELAFMHRDLASSQSQLASLQLENDERDAALKSIALSESNWQQLNDQHQGIPDLQAGLDLARARRLTLESDFEEADQTAKTLAERHPGRWTDAYNAACIYSWCVEELRRQPRNSSDEAFSHYRDRAMAILTDLAQQRHITKAKVAEDLDLRGIQNTHEFQDLLDQFED